MDTKEQIIRAAVQAFPDDSGEDYDQFNLEQLVEHARQNDLGDTLLSFIILELHEGLDGDVTLERAVRLMVRARRDLEVVTDRLEDSNIEV